MLIVAKNIIANKGQESVRLRAFNMAALAGIECSGRELAAIDMQGKIHFLTGYDSNERAAEVFNNITREYGEYSDNGCRPGKSFTGQPWAYEPPKVVILPEK